MSTRTYSFGDCGCSGATGGAPCSADVSTDSCSECVDDCILTLPAPLGASPYADLTEAASVLAAQVAACKVYIELGSGGILSSFSVSAPTGSLTVSAAGNPSNAPQAQAQIWAAVQLKAGSLDVDITAGSLFVGAAYLYDSEGTLVDDYSGTGPGVLTVPADGTYFLFCSATSTVTGFGGGTDSFGFDIAQADMVTCGVRAAYGATPDYLVCT